MKKLRLMATALTVGIIGGVIFTILRIFGRIKIKGALPKQPKDSGLLIISNHPSLWEAGTFPFLLFPRYLWNWRAVPFSTPDKENFYDKWWFALFRPVCVPVPRGDRKAEIQALQKMISTVQEKGTLILFAEGGRTYKGEGFKESKISGKRIRPFQNGAGAIARRAKPMIVPIWTEGGDKILPNRSCGSEFYWALPRLWKRMDVIIGQPLAAPDNLKTDELIDWLEDKLLDLADTIRG